ncbi:Abi family protein [Luteococcus sanguinis]|uniref:Abi family protein n=1 Tax=Luteococcus sanguinis TaxID=174038 RepID=A0ABW1X773_9ACTN
MAEEVPFLNLDGRVGYLYERGYFPRGSVTDEHRERLGSMNFHYFLGYARNYRMLTAQGLPCIQQPIPDDVFRVIDRDHEVAKLLYQGLRQAEWNLRSLAVEHYCGAHDPCGSFLREQQYVCTSSGSETEMVRGIINSVLRHGEPFVEDHIAAQASQRGAERPKKYDQLRHDELVGYIEDLPLWSVIDSFSLGLLSRFITQCDKPSDPDDAVWKKVADGLAIRHPVFLTNIESLTVLRNLVSHHARMWMRPTTVTPKKPKVFTKALRDADAKSMEVAFANVALFQGPRLARSYLDEVLALVACDPLYEHGVSKVRPTKV